MKAKDNALWSELDTQLMVMAAYRYCLGRQTYIVGSAVGWLLKHRTNFERNTLRVMVRDIVEALQDNTAGADCDVLAWTQLAGKLFSEMQEDDKQWVRASVAYKNKAWPKEIA